MRKIHDVIMYTITLAMRIKASRECKDLDKEIIEYHSVSKIPYAGIPTKHTKILGNLKKLSELNYDEKIINEFKSYLISYPIMIGIGSDLSHVDSDTADLSNSVRFMVEQITTALIEISIK